MKIPRSLFYLPVRGLPRDRIKKSSACFWEVIQTHHSSELYKNEANLVEAKGKEATNSLQSQTKHAAVPRVLDRLSIASLGTS